MNFDFAAMHAD